MQLEPTEKASWDYRKEEQIRSLMGGHNGGMENGKNLKIGC